MTKPKSVGTPETARSRQNTGASDGNPAAITRIDPPHEVSLAGSGPSAVEPSPPAASMPIDATPERVRLQADQLAGHLRNRQKELDHREAELNSQAARLESDARTARLWLSEREADLASRSELLAKREQEVEKQTLALGATEADRQTLVSASTAEKEEQLRRAAEALALQKKRLDEAESRLAEVQAETERSQKQFLQQQRESQEEIASLREQLVAEHQQAMTELAKKRRTVERRADHVDHCRAALKQLRGELGRMHRETLEIRLATEELWVQLAGAAPPAALTRSLGRIRSKLAEQYHHDESELAEQRKELEALREQLIQQHAALVAQKRQFEQWAIGRQDDCERQASRLSAREEQLRREEVEHFQQSQGWQAERMKYHQELRRLRVELAAHEETAVPA
jgi:hypothetical protein